MALVSRRNMRHARALACGKSRIVDRIAPVNASMPVCGVMTHTGRISGGFTLSPQLTVFSRQFSGGRRGQVSGGRRCQLPETATLCAQLSSFRPPLSQVWEGRGQMRATGCGSYTAEAGRGRRVWERKADRWLLVFSVPYFVPCFESSGCIHGASPRSSQPVAHSSLFDLQLDGTSAVRVVNQLL